MSIREKSSVNTTESVRRRTENLHQGRVFWDSGSGMFMERTVVPSKVELLFRAYILITKNFIMYATSQNQTGGQAKRV